MLLVFLVFATSLAALAVAGGTAWWRCGRDSDCSSELAFAIVAVAPACLIGILMVFLLRLRMPLRGPRVALLALGVGVAALPLAAFLLQDLRLLPAFAALLAAAVLLVHWGDRAEPEPTAAAGWPPAVPSEEGPPRVAEAPRAAVKRWRAPARPAAALAVLQELSALNHEIIRHCERLSPPGPAPASPGYRRPPGR